MSDDDGVALREFILVQLKAVEQRFADWIRYSEDRLARTERDLERRLESMNRFRDDLTEQAGTFITREAYELRHDALDRRIATLESTWAKIGGGLAVLVVVLELVLRLWK